MFIGVLQEADGWIVTTTVGFSGGSVVKSLLAMHETQVQTLGGEDPLEKENGNPLQCSCLGNPTDRRAWWATVHGITKSRTQLSDQATTTNYTLTIFTLPELIILYTLL